MKNRRGFLKSLCRTAAVYSFDQLMQGQQLPVSFVNIAREAGLREKTVFGDEKKNRYLVETTGCGVAFYDYDHDGWLDLFFVNGSRFQANFTGGLPSNRLYKNNRDGTFTDVTRKAGLLHHGWGQGVCVGDYDNDGLDDLFVSYWGENKLYKNRGDGTFEDVSRKAGITTAGGRIPRWNTGCAFVDYNRDGLLDLFVANYIDFDLKTVPVPENGTCKYKGLQVACGPPGLPGAKNILFRNNGDGTFSDVSKAAGILNTPGTYGLGVLVADFDNDGWPDIYVANDSTSSALYKNNHDGTFSEIGIQAGVAYSADGKSQAGMGVDAADFDGDGWLDIVKTNFAGDTSSLYRNLGENHFEDQTFQAGLGRNTRFLGWGAAFLDFDNDGWPDILLANGHVYPEVGNTDTEAGYKQRKVLYRNLGKSRFADVSPQTGPGILEQVSARGLAVGDFDNDGDLDVAVNCVNDVPQLLRCDNTTGRRWLQVKLIGTVSNRSAIGARVICRHGGRNQMAEVRSGGSYLSQSDLRLHFGLDQAETADLQIRWPNGKEQQLNGVKANQILRIVEPKD
ncbi:MAG: CRTAC1 family protein [Acidobacteria bacterium]|nr:CRTAC1 family protein [Acidobacteriota bacterium]